MAEPQPSNVQEGADAPDVLPANQEDRKAAQALSSLDARGGDEDGANTKKSVDLKALDDAMKRLDVNNTAQEQAKKPVQGKKEEPKKLIKVDPADVTLLVEQLDLSKVKATELLRAHDADAVKAMTAWVTSSA